MSISVISSNSILENHQELSIVIDTGTSVTSVNYGIVSNNEVKDLVEDLSENLEKIQRKLK